jgi:bifunctional non-homologous end joining protein LigD
MSPRPLLPCLPTRTKTPPSGELWIHEIKYDGFRLVAQRGSDGIRLTTKQGSDFSDRYSLIVTAMEKLKVKSICLDGEVMCFTGAEQDFDKLWARKHDDEARLCAFDLLELNGVDLRGLPLIERKKQLFKIIRRSVGIEFVEHVTGEGPRIFEKDCSLGYEGIVSKRVDRPYRSGQTKIWLKTKNPDHPAMQRVRDAFEFERLRIDRKLG